MDTNDYTPGNAELKAFSWWYDVEIFLYKSGSNIPRVIRMDVEKDYSRRVYMIKKISWNSTSFHIICAEDKNSSNLIRVFDSMDGKAKERAVKIASKMN